MFDKLHSAYPSVSTTNSTQASNPFLGAFYFNYTVQDERRVAMSQELDVNNFSMFIDSGDAEQGSKRASFLWPGPAQRGPAKVVARPARGFAWPARPGPGPMEIFFTAIFPCQNSKITCVINNVLESTLFQCYREFFSQIAEIEIKSIWDESSCLLSQTNKQKTFEDF